ncbi:MAG: site-specific integrase [Candidatus Latescibacteria bacterium]|nr:site-specific integrase [Candidatus Latescibacterota bacterium]
MAVYKRNSMWYIDYYVKVSGKRERRREPVSTRRDVAEIRLREYQQLIKEGKDPIVSFSETVNFSEVIFKPTDGVIPSLNQFIPVFLKLHGKNRSSKTQESYRSSLLHLAPVFGKVKVNNISKVMVKTYMAHRTNEGASNATINREIACLKCILSRGVEWEYIEKNPIHGLSMLQESPPIERYLTPEEAKHLIEVSPQYLREVIIFALGTGMRKSEILNLTWDDVVIDEVFKYGEITVNGKGNKRRPIRMNKTVYDLILRKSKEDNGQYVFPSMKTDKNLTTVIHSFTSALEKAGITNFRFHDLRHTSASWMVQGGASLYSVQKILGHSSIRTTQRYAHLSPGYLEKEIGKIDDFLSLEKESEETISEQTERAAV